MQFFIVFQIHGGNTVVGTPETLKIREVFHAFDVLDLFILAVYVADFEYLLITEIPVLVSIVRLYYSSEVSIREFGAVDLDACCSICLNAYENRQYQCRCGNNRD